MWLVMTNRMINMNNVSSIDIGEGEFEDSIEKHTVYLRYGGTMSSSESDIPLCRGSMKQCQKFMLVFQQYGNRAEANDFLDLDIIIREANIR